MKEITSENVLQQTNLLLIMYDDLRPELSIYGREHMITPNFERLAKRSIVFDYSFCQVAVCNPSRDSLLTGLRPDSVGSYNFQSSYAPNILLPQQLIRSGYNTAGFGKILHWEPREDKNIWNFDHYEGDWYDYQNKEGNFMNSSAMPDKYKKEEDFRDHTFTTRLISALREMHVQPKYFMAAIGFKLPHLALHVPYNYYALYKNKTELWKLNKKELRFPPSTPAISYRCCADPSFKFMNDEGSKRHDKEHRLPDINHHLPEKMHDELMMSYCGGVSYLDFQLGRILDVLDELKLWNNLTVVLSSDHGMHNGEKGIWEKWSLFEESSRVPLLISHPLSPFQGLHYNYPTESIDIYATINDILGIPKLRKDTCKGTGDSCQTLQGKSLGPVLFGSDLWDKIIQQDTKGLTHTKSANVPHNAYYLFKPNMTITFFNATPIVRVLSPSTSPQMPIMKHDFAITQALRCANKNRVIEAAKAAKLADRSQKHIREHMWEDCDKYKKTNLGEEICLLGYAMRTPDFRYVCYFHFDRLTAKPQLDVAPFAEELYDHRNEALKDFTHLETVNVAKRSGFEGYVAGLRTKLIDFIKKDVKFKGP